MKTLSLLEDLELENELTYNYDKQYQLTQANRSYGSYIWNYQYDTYGNVRDRDYRCRSSKEKRL